MYMCVCVKVRDVVALPATDPASLATLETKCASSRRCASENAVVVMASSCKVTAASSIVGITLRKAAIKCNFCFSCSSVQGSDRATCEATTKSVTAL